MKQTREWSFQVTAAGHLPGQVHREFDDLVRGLAGKRITIKLSLYRKRRSTSANAYYWGVVVKSVTALFREHGNYLDDEEIHEFLKLRVGKLAQVIVLPDGEVVKGLGSTAKLTTSEFASYIMQIKAWGAEYGLQIPDPEESLTSLVEES